MTGLLILSFPQYYVVAPMYQSQDGHVALLMYQPELFFFTNLLVIYYSFIPTALCGTGSTHVPDSGWLCAVTHEPTRVVFITYL